METLRLGSTGPVVARWQMFLRGEDLYTKETHGRFDQDTFLATKAYQTSRGLKPVDGIAGNGTLGKAMTEGFAALDDTGIYDDFDERGPNWPPRPVDLKPASFALRQQMFGTFSYVKAPTAGNPEGIDILGTWERDNLVTIEVPQLKGVTGAGKGLVTFHKVGAPKLLALFAAWEAEGLLPLVLAWGGSFAPRFIRGSTSVLSNHAWATAFDINVAQNGLGRRPALVGEKGSVRKLVPLAAEHGFSWGGWFPTRPDGMHFELVKV